jgi:hypothetical protein
MRLSSKTTSRRAHNFAMPGGIDDRPVASTVADVKEADMDYSFLAGNGRHKKSMDGQ